MKRKIVFKIFLILIAVGLLFNSQKTIAQKSVTISGTEGSKTVQFTGISLDMSEKAYVTLDINNLSGAELFIDWYYKGPWPMHQIDAADVVLPNQNKPVKNIFYRKNITSSSPWYSVLSNVSSLPGNHVTHWRAFDYQDLQKVQVTISWKNDEGASGKVTIGTPYASGEYTFPDIDYNSLSKPLIDEMGQYVHDTWDMKLNNISELQDLAKEDIDKYVGASFDTQFSQFGGIKNAPRYDSTGFFQTKKINGKWWFINPDGYLFWSIGATGVGSGSATGTAGRREIFPTFDDEKGAALWPVLEEETTGREIDFYTMNIKRKYGAEWETLHEAVTYGRLKTRGLNTAGAWSRYPQKVKHPYTFWIWYPFVDYFLNTAGKAVKMMDPFSGNTKQQITNNIINASQNRNNDPWLLGVFVHNELDWEYEMNVPEMVLKMTNIRPARLEMENRLKSQYNTIQNLNDTWGSSFSSFESANGENTSDFKTAFTNDMLDYLKHFAETYFSYVSQEVKKYFPNHMYLGERFKSNSFENKIVHNIAARYCDVFSINLYSFTIDGLYLTIDVDKPWIIGEYGTATGTHGVWGGGNAYSVEHQAALLKYYLKAGLEHPNLVGAHWFQYPDQMTTGRPSNGENARRGIVNITDQLYLPLVIATKECSEKMYEWRTGDSLATGLRNIYGKKSNDIKIYPNPNDGNFYVEIYNHLETKLEIFTISGQKVYEANFQDDKNINLPSKMNGIFLVKVENTGETITKSIIIE